MTLLKTLVVAAAAAIRHNLPDFPYSVHTHGGLKVEENVHTALKEGFRSDSYAPDIASKTVRRSTLHVQFAGGLDDSEYGPHQQRDRSERYIVIIASVETIDRETGATRGRNQWREVIERSRYSDMAAVWQQLCALFARTSADTVWRHTDEIIEERKQREALRSTLRASVAERSESKTPRKAKPKAELPPVAA